MKKIRILTSALEIRNAQMPVTDEFKALKLTYAQAMSFQSKFTSFEELLTEYGISNRLQVGEFYEGYLAVYYWGGHVEVVNMHGQIEKIDPAVASVVWDYRLAENIREGKAWQCVYPMSGGNVGVGAFRYVWTFSDCNFAQDIAWTQRNLNNVVVRNAYPPEVIACYDSINAEQMDEQLKSSIIAALLTDERMVMLSDSEIMVLKHYLGEVYYKAFFCEVE